MLARDVFAAAPRLVVCAGALWRRGSLVDRFIARQNIEHFRQLLVQAGDPKERAPRTILERGDRTVAAGG